MDRRQSDILHKEIEHVTNHSGELDKNKVRILNAYGIEMVMEMVFICL